MERSYNIDDVILYNKKPCAVVMKVGDTSFFAYPSGCYLSLSDVDGLEKNSNYVDKDPVYTTSVPYITDAEYKLGDIVSFYEREEGKAVGIIHGGDHHYLIIERGAGVCNFSHSDVNDDFKNCKIIWKNNYDATDKTFFIITDTTTVKKISELTTFESFDRIYSVGDVVRIKGQKEVWIVEKIFQHKFHIYGLSDYSNKMSLSANQIEKVSQPELEKMINDLKKDAAEINHLASKSSGVVEVCDGNESIATICVPHIYKDENGSTEFIQPQRKSTIKMDITSAAWRIASHQANKLVKHLLLEAIKKTGKWKKSEEAVLVRLFNSSLSEPLISITASKLLDMLPDDYKNSSVDILIEELRIYAISKVGEELINKILESIGKQKESTVLKSIIHQPLKTIIMEEMEENVLNITSSIEARTAI